MRLTETLKKAGCICTMVQDGEFKTMEQCTQIRMPQALAYLDEQTQQTVIDAVLEGADHVTF